MFYYKSMFNQSTNDHEYYDILEINKNSTETEIKKSYKKLAMKWHPDRNRGNKESENKFKQISEAYEVLSNPTKKKLYDAYGKNGLEMQDGHDMDNMDSMFHNFFGNDFNIRKNDKIEPIIKELYLTIEEIYYGSCKKIIIEKQIIVDKNNIVDCQNSIQTCSSCKGTGIINNIQKCGIMFSQTQMICGLCKKKGFTIKEGYKLKSINEEIEFNIPKGIKQGEKIILKNLGNINFKNTKEKGDVIILIKEFDHSRFIRKQNNLFYTHSISIFEALIGFKMNIVNIQDKTLEISIDEPVDNDSVKILLNQGMPDKNNNYGNIIINFKIENPSINFEEKKIIQNNFSKYFKNKTTESTIKHKIECIDAENYHENKYENENENENENVQCPQS